MSTRSALALFAIALSTAACTGSGGGGGNNVEPCCSAEGQTVPPGSGFGSTPARYVQAVKVNPAPAFTDCPDLDAALDFSGIVLAEGSDIERVEDDGSFSLELYEEVLGAPAVGERFFVIVFDGSGGDRVDRGMGSLAEVAATDATIGVAPILFGAAGLVGETTLEAGVACVMGAAQALDPQGADSLQGMTLTDVRAFVDDSIVTAFNATPTGPTPRLLGVRDLAKDYRHGINGMIAVLNSSGLPQLELDAAIAYLEDYRDDAETLSDECRLGLVGYEGCQGVVAPLRADSYRYWYLARNVNDAAYPIVWNGEGPSGYDTTQVLAAWADDVFLRLQADGNITGAYELAAFRQNQLLRLELAHANLRVAYSQYGDADGIDNGGDGLFEGPLSLTSSMTGANGTWTGLEGPSGSVETLRQQILTGSEGVIVNAWGVFANHVAYNFGLQANALNMNSDYSDDFLALYSTNVVSVGSSAARAARFDMLDGCNQFPGTDWTNNDIRYTLFGSGSRCAPTVQDGPYVQVYNGMTTNFSSDLDNVVVADVVFWATLNAQ